MKWQKPTNWSWETTDGEFYIEYKSGAYLLYNRRRLIQVFLSLKAAKLAAGGNSKGEIMTPREIALDAAYRADDNQLSHERFKWMLDAYLTTLLNSPEMVEVVAKQAQGKYEALKWNALSKEYKAIWKNVAKAVIAAIKKEAGL